MARFETLSETLSFKTTAFKPFNIKTVFLHANSTHLKKHINYASETHVIPTATFLTLNYCLSKFHIDKHN